MAILQCKKLTVKTNSGGYDVPVFERRGFVTRAEQPYKRAGTLETNHIHNFINGVLRFGEQQLGALQPQMDQELVGRLVIS